MLCTREQLHECLGVLESVGHIFTGVCGVTGHRGQHARRHQGALWIFVGYSMLLRPQFLLSVEDCGVGIHFRKRLLTMTDRRNRFASRVWNRASSCQRISSLRIPLQWHLRRRHGPIFRVSRLRCWVLLPNIFLCQCCLRPLCTWHVGLRLLISRARLIRRPRQSSPWSPRPNFSGLHPDRRSRLAKSAVLELGPGRP